MKISDYIIMSDVDGTLLPYGSEMPRRNIEALERFVSKGGKFGIATGRAKEVIEEFIEDLPVNAPCVVHNGGGIYDVEKDEYLMQMFLPESVKDGVKCIYKEFSDISVFVVADGTYYQISDASPVSELSEEHSKHMKVSNIDAITSPWYKTAFLMPESRVASFNEYIAGAGLEGVRLVYVNQTMAELIPEGSSKGFALKELVRLGLFKRECVAAVGDYYNDLEMIEFAAIGAATAEAPDDIKAKAQFITGPAKDGAVADLVEYLESIAD